MGSDMFVERERILAFSESWNTQNTLPITLKSKYFVY